MKHLFGAKHGGLMICEEMMERSRSATSAPIFNADREWHKPFTENNGFTGNITRALEIDK
jgi:hypothetical protein